MVSASTNAAAAQRAVAPRRIGHGFYIAITAAMTCTCFLGFWFTYFGPLARGSYPPAGIPLHLHGWSFFLWYLLLPAQVGLVARRLRPVHEILGYASVALVVVMTTTGMVVLSVRVEEAMRTGVPDVWVPYGPLILSSLVLFLGFYVAALRAAFARQLEAHRRLMIVASAAGLGAATFRVFLYASDFHPLSVPIGTVLSSLFVVAAIAHEWLRRRQVHRVYTVGLAVLLVVQTAVLPQVNEPLVLWLDAGLARLGEFAGLLYQPDPTVQFQ